jgi:hypothetical protein
VVAERPLEVALGRRVVHQEDRRDIWLVVQDAVDHVVGPAHLAVPRAHGQEDGDGHGGGS